MTHIEAMKQMVEALEEVRGWQWAGPMRVMDEVDDAIAVGRQAIAELEKQEPVAVTRMMEWVDYLKRKSDYGQHKQIPSEMSAGACWDLAIELEQFIKQSPPQRQWVWLTAQEIADMATDFYGSAHHDDISFGSALQAKLKEKNT
jgi:hypothetical protein